MRTAVSAALMLALAAAPTNAQSYMMDGNMLLETCTANTAAQAGQCRGFIIGSWDAAVFYDHVLFQVICVPNVPASQIEDVVIKYLEDNPADRHKSAAELLMAALSDAFSC